MRTTILFFTLLTAALSACSGSHVRGRDGGGGGGEPCGPTTCAPGEVCCNASCGICTAPGGGCPAVACVDAGGASCGSSVCESGEICCPGCPGAPRFCVSGSTCPDLVCPPPPPGCESCGPGQLCCPACAGDPSFCVSADSCPPLGCPPPPPPGCESCGPGELCCPGCVGDPSFCVSGGACPDVDCPPPPPGCESCGPGELCCPSCPGLPSFCVSGFDCPDVDCPAPSCEGLSYCECADHPACAPLIDLTTGCVCPCEDPFNCTGALCDCACGGAQYRGCTEAGRCPVTELRCDPPCSARRGPDGCLVCLCADVGG